jgi:hypothetical protein
MKLPVVMGMSSCIWISMSPMVVCMITLAMGVPKGYELIKVAIGMK